MERVGRSQYCELYGCEIHRIAYADEYNCYSPIIMESMNMHIFEEAITEAKISGAH